VDAIWSFGAMHHVSQKRIDEQISHYQINPDLSTRINQSKKWDNIIRDCANKLGYKPNSFVILF